MKVIIVTGGIGSGKSTVCSILQSEFGFPIYEADRRVKELYQEHPALLTDIEKALGETYRNEEGRFVPAGLASRIFSDPAALRVVEGIVFPILRKDFDRWKIQNADKDFLVLESATILQKPELIGLGDYVAVVDAPLELRIKRALERGGLSYDSVYDRARNQELMNDISAGNVPSSVDYVIMNDGSRETLSENVRKCIELIYKVL